ARRLATRMNWCSGCSAFFFQAEAGIRDFHVTGVQTCALPISLCLWLAPLTLIGLFLDVSLPSNAPVIAMAVQFLALAALFQLAEIGRASCRDRVERTAGAISCRRNSQVCGWRVEFWGCRV